MNLTKIITTDHLKDRDISSQPRVHTKILEIDLPKEFCIQNDKEILFMLFSNNLKTGGKEILENESIYDQKALKAFIHYENEEVADRVASRKVIIFDSYLFNVRLASVEPNPVLAKSLTENGIQVIRLTCLKKDEKITFDIINNQFMFLKKHIIVFEIEPSLTSAIVKLNSIKSKIFFFFNFN